MASCPRCTMYVADHPLHWDVEAGCLAVQGPCFHKCPEPFEDVAATAALARSLIGSGAIVSPTMKARLTLTLEGPYREKGPWRG